MIYLLHCFRLKLQLPNTRTKRKARTMPSLHHCHPPAHRLLFYVHRNPNGHHQALTTLMSGQGLCRYHSFRDVHATLFHRNRPLHEHPPLSAFLMSCSRHFKPSRSSKVLGSLPSPAPAKPSFLTLRSPSSQLTSVHQFRIGVTASRVPVKPHGDVHRRCHTHTACRRRCDRGYAHKVQPYSNPK